MSAPPKQIQGVSARDRRIFFRQLHSRAQHGDRRPTRPPRFAGGSLPEGRIERRSRSGRNRGRFEIWNLQRWKRAHEEETPTYQHVANVIGL